MGDGNKMRKWAKKDNIGLGKLAIAAPMKAMRAMAPRARGNSEPRCPKPSPDAHFLARMPESGRVGRGIPQPVRQRDLGWLWSKL